MGGAKTCLYTISILEEHRFHLSNINSIVSYYMFERKEQNNVLKILLYLLYELNQINCNKTIVTCVMFMRVINLN